MHKKILFAILFVIIGFVALQIPVTKLLGSSVSFTLFDFFGPMAGAFLGGPLGVLAVFLVSLTNFALKGFTLEAGPIIRLFPTLFAVWYFSLAVNKKADRKILAIPILAMFAFWAHPIGREVWYYPLFWTIPIMAFFKREHLLIRSLGTTFTAHAVGGATWIWAFNLPTSVWQGLIPIVIMERFVFTLGISVSFVLMTNVISYLTSKKLLPTGLRIETAYKVIDKRTVSV